MKNRTYTVQSVANAPCLTLRGKWLNRFGLDFGDQLKLIEGKNMLVLVKVPATVAAQNRIMKELAILEEQAEYLRSTL